MLDPDETVGVDSKRLKSMKESPVSMMPRGLVITLSKVDVLDFSANFRYCSGQKSENRTRTMEIIVSGKRCEPTPSNA